MSSGLTSINRAINLIPKRAEQQHGSQLRKTFVDSGVASVLEAIDHQVIYGRRGTGKTHALRYLESELNQNGQLGIYLDLRTIGSPDGIAAEGATSPNDRAARLLVDLLGNVHDALLTAAIENDDLTTDAAFVDRLDALLSAITTVRVSGEVELSREGEKKEGERGHVGGQLGLSSVAVGGGVESNRESRALMRETRRGSERIGLNFADVARALKNLAESLSSRRVWLLLDEWSSVPSDVQPLLGEFLVRCVFPLQRITVKIAAIEQQTNFRDFRPDGTVIGIELGADVAANLDLDEFMVFESNEDRARSFFRGLFFKHLTSGADGQNSILGLNSEADLVRLGFTDKRSFDELVRAAEGVPRDAINIAGKAAVRAGTSTISIHDVRTAARSWFQSDKDAALKSHPKAPALLNWIIDEVIRHRRARGFLVPQHSASEPLLLSLFDARVLHLVRRGYSAQDAPGERYDVWVIDYGAYVDLINTKSAPQGILPFGEGSDPDGFVDVPTQDLRAIRRAILDLDKFEQGRK